MWIVVLRFHPFDPKENKQSAIDLGGVVHLYILLLWIRDMVTYICPYTTANQ